MSRFPVKRHMETPFFRARDVFYHATAGLLPWIRLRGIHEGQGGAADGNGLPEEEMPNHLLV